ncbi:5-formyltetrahydrofolate cyclo-ligase [Ligilactobacillus animalis]|jgi:5-formyltetrahydrofolate cyclo-ligase|uniref:5-formyltetrahydrofolate cyclo-ligase n=1 Tax=Ligilactobacillus animalis TaxID=1605 RepID=UPI0025945DA2|nr:5-formyltetrahydrofolate cyclo-ligase [Ligilactobacillus animalis]
MQTKIEFRKQQLEKLANNTLETNASGSKLAEKLFMTDIWQQAQTIGLTMAGKIEVPTEMISVQAKREGKRVFLSAHVARTPDGLFTSRDRK